MLAVFFLKVALEIKIKILFQNKENLNKLISFAF